MLKYEKQICTGVSFFFEAECIYAFMRALFLTQNTGSQQVKNRETISEKLKFGCMFKRGKTSMITRTVLFFQLKAPT